MCTLDRIVAHVLTPAVKSGFISNGIFGRTETEISTQEVKESSSNVHF